MPRYRLILTREVTESVTIETNDRDNYTVPDTGWELDETPNRPVVYVTDCEEVTE